MASARQPARAEPAGAGGTITVTQLAAMIDGALRDNLATGLRVAGEVSGFTNRTHWYFQLKDAGAVVGCVMFASAVRRAGFTPRNGQEVVATGRVEFYAPQGRTQFYVEKLEPVGVGALELEFRRLCEELRALGWFDVARKKALPFFPRRIAVVTSKGSAALQDVLDTLRRRAPCVEVGLVDVRVQGEGAAEAVAGAIDWLGRTYGPGGSRAGEIDAVLVTRGGGSMEDLWAFNERLVAEAIVGCPLPLVAAIGHETDTTIAELVADERAATPTQAAMRLSPDCGALTEQVTAFATRLSSALGRHVRHDRDRLRAAARHPFFMDPGVVVTARRERLEAATQRLTGAVDRRVRMARQRLLEESARLEKNRPAEVHARRSAALGRAEALLHAAWTAALRRRADRVEAIERALELVGPQAVLARGFSVTLRGDGSALRRAEQAIPGERITTVLADGKVRSVVEGGGPRVAGGTGRRRPRADVEGQERLF